MLFLVAVFNVKSTDCANRFIDDSTSDGATLKGLSGSVLTISANKLCPLHRTMHNSTRSICSSTPKYETRFQPRVKIRASAYAIFTRGSDANASSSSRNKISFWLLFAKRSPNSRGSLWERAYLDFSLMKLHINDVF